MYRVPVSAATQASPYRRAGSARLDARGVEVEQPGQRQADEQEVAAQLRVGQHLHGAAVGLSGGFFGHVTSSARSSTDNWPGIWRPIVATWSGVRPAARARSL